MGRGSHEGSEVIETQPSFWNWSVSTYAQRGVADSLLRLQDKLSLNVNLALWCVWCAMRCNDLPEAAILRAHAAIRALDEQVTRPLRAVRRTLRDLEAQGDAEALQEVGTLVKSAELRSEEMQQSILENLTPSCDPPLVTDREARIPSARRNLATYAGIAGAARLPGFSVSMLEAVIEAIHPPAADTRTD